MSVAITSDELSRWSQYVQEISGIALDPTKGYLIETRLGELLRSAGCRNYSELLGKARSDPSHALQRKVLDSITTNETSFFRDLAPFELLRHKLIPELVDARSQNPKLPIRIWSAACSTGQEAYSIAIVFKEVLRDLSRYDIRILGTDISNKAVAQASYAEYTKLELERGLTESMRAQYFQASHDKWRLRDDLRSLVSFRTLNLLEAVTTPTKFDIIFCRNVAIYFEQREKLRVFQNLRRALAPRGAIVIGSTETIGNLCPDLEAKRHLRAVYYQER